MRRRRRRSLGNARLAPPGALPAYGLGEHPGNEPVKAKRARGGATTCGPPVSGHRRIQICVKRGEPGPVVSQPYLACKLLKDAVHADRESFYSILLDTRGRVLGIEEVAKGTLNGVEVHPREVFKSAVMMNAQALIIAHNHPSGDPSPSRQDIELTQRLLEVSRAIGIPIRDHVILAAGGCTSLREHPQAIGMEFGQARRGLRRFLARRRR